MAILERDYDYVARLHYDAGMLSENVPLPLFAQSLRSVVEPVLGKALGDISLGIVLGQILKILHILIYLFSHNSTFCKRQ